MTYRWERQPDGLYTVKDVAIFAACERNGIKFDVSWLKAAVKFAREAEKNNRRAQVIIKHNKPGESFETEDSAGLLGNLRFSSSVRVENEVRPGIIADLFDLTEEDKDRIVTNRLCGRSVEILRPKGQPKIDALALLGRTSPYFGFAQGSEDVPEDQQFAQIGVGTDEGQRIFFMMGNPPAPGAPAAPPAAPSPAPQGGGNPQVMALLQQLMQLLGGGAPAAPQAPPAAKPPAPPAPNQATAHMQDDAEPETFKEEDAVTDLEKLKAENEILKARLAEVVEERNSFQAEAAKASEKVEEVSEDAIIAARFSKLREEGFAFDEAAQRSLIDRIGFDSWNSLLAPTLPKAPLAPKGGIVPAPVTPDDTLESVGFAALNPALKEVALVAAKEYDAEASVFQEQGTTKESYIQFALHQARQGV